MITLTILLIVALLCVLVGCLTGLLTLPRLQEIEIAV